MNRYQKINWDEQWALHAPGFRQGCLPVDMRLFCNDPCTTSFFLKAGPGFGDLSHPTTRLVLRMMSPYIRNKDILDLGCGSGILSLASVALGARSVIGIDIDDAAIQHARKNAELNRMGKWIRFLRPEDFKIDRNKESFILLMNMIHSEQRAAWASLPKNIKVDVAVTSGVLVPDAGSYLDLCAKWGWEVKTMAQEEEWQGFVFRNRSRGLA